MVAYSDKFILDSGSEMASNVVENPSLTAHVWVSKPDGTPVVEWVAEGEEVSKISSEEPPSRLVQLIAQIKISYYGFIRPVIKRIVTGLKWIAKGLDWIRYGILWVMIMSLYVPIIVAIMLLCLGALVYQFLISPADFEKMAKAPFDKKWLDTALPTHTKIPGAK